jgi:hypothetical protein
MSRETAGNHGKLWACQTITICEDHPKPPNKETSSFCQGTKAYRIHIERAFGVLQARFVIARGPACFWDKKTLKNIMTCCVILHN